MSSNFRQKIVVCLEGIRETGKLSECPLFRLVFEPVTYRVQIISVTSLATSLDGHAV